MFPFLRLLLLSVIVATASAADSIRNELLTVTIDQGRYTIQASVGGAPFASGALHHRGVIATAPRHDGVFGDGQELTVTSADGSGESFQVFPRLPFVLIQDTLVNAGAQAAIVNKVVLAESSLALGVPAERLKGLGTGGLHPLLENPGSYAWMAVADPEHRAGVVGGWLTHERGNGVVASHVADGTVSLEARLEYGHLRLEAGKSVRSETYALGWFADVRLGLEAWADAVAKRLAIVLPPMPVVYCTWYDNVHGGPSNAQALAELSTFAAKALKPYGLSCIQIDDGWQLGDPKGNGPRKNFSAYDPQGPYAHGMKPTADGITAVGLTAGLWMLPFGGSWNDPFFAPHQDWFVTHVDGKPYDTAWGGTALDMTNPDARSFVQGEVRQAVHDWGYHYLKLDGLSTGIGVQPQYINDSWKEDHLGDAIFHDPSTTNIEAFRTGLRMIRTAVGATTFLLGCCAPQNMRSYAGVFGLVDAMRMGPDNNGSWDGWKGSSPDFGTRNYHLNGRIWWSDPDPIYVRASIPLDSARCIASWNAVSGQMISLSDWLPTLPADRLDIIRRCIPGHGVSARPIDLFSAALPRQWLVTDQRPDRQRRDVLGLFNWTGQPVDMTLTALDAGLPQADRYIAFDFWSRTFIKPFTSSLDVRIPAAGCRVIAVRPLVPHPFILSTSRHVTQGITDVKKEAWDAGTGLLTGTSEVVAEDEYEVRVVARSPSQAWSLERVQVSAADAAAGVTITATGGDGLFRIRIRSPLSREVAWQAHVTATAAAASGAPARIAGAAAAVNEDGDSVLLSWTPVDGMACEVAGASVTTRLSDSGSLAIPVSALPTDSRFILTAIDWSGRRSDALVLSAPPAPALLAVPPRPDIPLTSLTAIEASTGYGSITPNASVSGKPLTIGGAVHANGIGVHAQSVLVYEVKPAYHRFVAVAGIDDEVRDSPASVVFSVIAEVDGQQKLLAASPRRRSTPPLASWHFNVAIPEHCSRLRLVVSPAGDGINSDHADWADAGFCTQ